MPYTITLPNGDTVDNIPDNISPEDAAEKLRKSLPLMSFVPADSPSTQEEEEEKEEDIIDIDNKKTEDVVKELEIPSEVASYPFPEQIIRDEDNKIFNNLLYEFETGKTIDEPVNFNTDVLKEMREISGYSDAEKQIIAEFVNTPSIQEASDPYYGLTFLGSEKLGQGLENSIKDNSAISFGFGFGKALFGGAGGIADLIGFEEDNYFNKKVDMVSKIQQEGLNEALINGDIGLFKARAAKRGVGDVGGNLILISRLMKATSFFSKGKNLNLIAKGKSYKELFKVTSLRTAFMGGYAFLTTTGDLETRTENMLVMAAFSATPLVTSLGKTNFQAIVQDIGLNAIISTTLLKEDAEKRAEVLARQVVGENASEEEFFEAYKQFRLVGLMEIYGADVVFGTMTRSINAQKTPKKELIKFNKTDNIILRQGKTLVNKIIKGTNIEQLKPEPIQTRNFGDLKIATFGELRAEAKARNIKASGKGVTKISLRKEIQKARLKEAKIEAAESAKVVNARRKKETVELLSYIDGKIGKRKVKTGITGKTKPESPIKALAKKFFSPDNLIDILDGSRGKYTGLAYKRLIDARRDGNAKALKNSQARKESFDILLNKLKIKGSFFGKKIKIKGLDEKITISDALGIYAKSRQVGGDKAIINGNFNGNKVQFDEVIKYVTNNKSLQKVADFIIADYGQSYQRLRNAFEQNTGKPLRQIDFYVPLTRTDATIKGSGDVHKMFDGTDKGKFTVNDSFGKTRRVSNLKVNTDLIGEYKKMIDLQEHYMAQYKNVQTLNSVIGHIAKNYKGAKGLDGYVKELESYRDIVANPMSFYTRSADARVSSVLRRNVAFAYLGFNVKTMLKQIPSYFRYMEDLGSPAEAFGRLMDASAAYATSFKIRKNPVTGKREIYNELAEFVRSNDPVIKETSVAREIDEFRLAKPTLYNKIIQKGAELGFKGILLTDRAVRTSGWFAVYTKAKQDGFSEKQAITQARNSTVRTQPTNRPEELASIYRSNEALNWLLQFSNQLNRNTNAFFVRSGRLAKGALERDKESTAALFSLITSAALSGTGIWIIDNGRLPEDEDDLVEIFRDTTLSAGTPLGNFALQNMKGYDYSLPIADAGSELIELGKKIANWNKGIEKSKFEWKDVETILAARGVPVQALKRIEDAFFDAYTGEEFIRNITGVKKIERKD